MIEVLFTQEARGFLGEGEVREELELKKAILQGKGPVEGRGAFSESEFQLSNQPVVTTAMKKEKN